MADLMLLIVLREALFCIDRTFVLYFIYHSGNNLDYESEALGNLAKEPRLQKYRSVYSGKAADVLPIDGDLTGTQSTAVIEMGPLQMRSLLPPEPQVPDVFWAAVP